MKEIPQTTNVEIVILVSSIQCEDLDVPLLREKTRKNLDIIGLCYNPTEYPHINSLLNQLEEDLKDIENANGTLKKVFWYLHIYLCFYVSDHSAPLHPKTPSEKGFLTYLIYLYRKAKTA